MTRTASARRLPVGLSLFSVFLFPFPFAAAQPADGAALRGDSPPTRKRLAEAEARLVGGKGLDAADELQRLLDEAGDDWVSLDGRQFRPARWVAHQLLAKLPPDALKAYQARVDAPARKLLDAGRRSLDPGPLWQLLDRYFVSRPAADGLLLLGDLLFERGEFRTAELVWRRLLPDAGADVSHPSPPADLAPVRARVVLAAVFAGELDRAAAELKAFAEKHPAAAGPFAGKTGPYADALRGYLDRPPRPPADPAGATDWPTFAADPGRTGRARGPIPHHWPAVPTWVAPIPGAVAAPPGVAAAPGRPPFGHPVVADGKVYVADAGRVYSFDLRTGLPAAAPSRPRPGPAFPPRGGAPDPDPCATLTWADGRLYARAGPAAVRSPDVPRPGRAAEESAIVCYAPPADPGRPLREAWRLPPPQPGEGKKTAAWEGAPLVAGGRLWAALARFEDGRVVHAVAGLDPADPDPPPDRPNWAVDVCDAPAGTDPRGRQELLTLAGRHVVLCSNTGAVVAVDAVTGRRAWAFLYPRAVRRTEPPRSADPSPAVAAGGRVFVAPADADRVFALDAETGKLLWESERAEGAAIVGVTRGRVIVTTTGPVRGLRALSAVTGSYRRPDGWVQSGTSGDWLGYGRGFVTDRAVVWPSRSRYGLYFLDPETGEPIPTAPPVRGPRNGLFGNVAYADGVLVVVTPTEVWGFVAEGKPPADPPDPDPRRRVIAAVDRAERQLADGDATAARAALREVARGEYPAGWRAWAAARLLLLGPPADDVRDVPTSDLLPEWLATSAGEIVTLRTLIDRHTGRPEPPKEPPAPIPVRQPGEVADLSPGACVRHEVRLPPASRPLRLIPGGNAAEKHLFVATPDRLLAVALAAPDRSVTDYPAADLFTHAADLPRGFVAAGPSAVAVYDTPGEAPWVFRVPDADPLPDGPARPPLRTDGPPAPLLSSFALAGAWLVARLGEHHLLALDLPGRRVAWVRGGDGRAGYFPVGFGSAPRFCPEVFTSDRLVVVQLSDGRRWALDRDTGRARGPDEPTARVAWAGPPVGFAGRVLFPDGPGLVRLANPITGRERWVYEAGGEASLAGDPPAVRAWGEAVIAAVRRDYGVDLDRIDPADGGSLWAGDGAFVDAGRLDLRQADADGHHLYVPAGNRVLAVHLGNGKPAWSADLPEPNTAAGWAVRAAGRVVIVYPAEAVPAEPAAGVLERAGWSWLRFPAGWRLPGLAAAVYDSWTDRAAPVLLFDPETGERLKELVVPGRGPGVAARLTADALVLATGDRVVWVR
jgi:outer membrane protein assembly factor BamB